MLVYQKFEGLSGEMPAPENNWKLLGELRELAGDNLPAALWPVSDRAPSANTVDARETFGRRFRRGRRPSPSAAGSETLAEHVGDRHGRRVHAAVPPARAAGSRQTVAGRPCPRLSRLRRADDHGAAVLATYGKPVFRDFPHVEAVKKLGQAPSRALFFQGFRRFRSEPVPFFHSLGVREMAPRGLEAQ
jgi:hypothetical protein